MESVLIAESFVAGIAATRVNNSNRLFKTRFSKKKLNKMVKMRIQPKKLISLKIKIITSR